MPSCPSSGKQPLKKARRSRYGCRNCKLRKLKCDEHRPQCRNCKSYGVSCNFAIFTPDLEPIAGSLVTKSPLKCVTKPRVIGNAVWAGEGSTSYELDSRCQSLIFRYLGLNLMNPNDAKMGEVNAELLSLAFKHPYLMHASLAVAFAYDRYLYGGRQTVEECFHRSRGTSLFNRRLKQPIRGDDKDAIWGTAAALTMLTFACPDGDTPEEAWPMTSCTSTQFSWLRINRGKMSLWTECDPMGQDSIFHILADTYAEMSIPLTESGIDGVPKALADLCNLSDSSMASNNSYFDAAHAVSKLQRIPDHRVSVGHTEIFTRVIRGTFEDLLVERDPVALLLLYLWYQKVRRIWWIDLRARIECPSIQSYLHLYHRDDNALQALFA